MNNPLGILAPFKFEGTTARAQTAMAGGEVQGETRHHCGGTRAHYRR